MRRWGRLLALGVLWVGLGLAHAGQVTNLPKGGVVGTDPALGKYLGSLDSEFRDSLIRNYAIFCGSNTLTTTQVCENARPYVFDACTVMEVRLAVTTAPTGSALIVDVNECESTGVTCTSLWATTQGNRVQINTGSTAGSQTTFDTRYIEAGNRFSIDLDQIGSSTAGGPLTVNIACRLGTVTP